jgi:hypothetical protein
MKHIATLSIFLLVGVGIGKRKMKLIAPLIILLSTLVPSFIKGQVLCINCYNQNDSISIGVNNLLRNGSFEINNCIPWGGGVQTYFCPNSNLYNCDIDNWICSGGGIHTYSLTVDSTVCFIPDGRTAVYFGNSQCNACSLTFGDTTCLSTSVCEIPSIPPGYPQSVNSGYGGDTGVSLSQTVTGLTSGNIYVLEFWAGGEGFSYVNQGLFAVDVGFGNSFLRNNPTGPTDTGTVYIIQFKAAASSHTIRFTNWGHIGFGCTELVIDNVRLYPLAQLSSSVTPCFACNITQPVISSNQGTFCANDSTQICAATIYLTYLWNTSSTDQCIYANQAGNYYLTVTDNNGCTAESNHLAITVLQSPPVSISVNGDTLSVYGAVAQQWYLNGSAINGATSNTYIANQGGSYTVMVTDTNGCAATSSAVIISGIENVSEEDVVSVYQLTRGSWQLTIGNNYIGGEEEIFDANGRLVFKSAISNHQSEISFSAAQGVYLLRISSSKSSVVRKLVRL